MLEILVDDTDRFNGAVILDDKGEHTSHDETNRNTGFSCLCDELVRLNIGEIVHLEGNARRLSRFVVLNLPANSLPDEIAQIEWRTMKMLQLRWLKGTIEEPENLPHIFPHALVVGHQQVICKDHRSIFVEISCAQNRVVTILSTLATSDMDQLAVYLEPLHSELNVDAGVAILARPFDVGLLIESCLRLAI